MRIIAALCSVFFVSQAWGLAAVESRTGEPVVRESQRMSPYNSSRDYSSRDNSARVVQEEGQQVIEIMPGSDYREFHGSNSSYSSSQDSSHNSPQSSSQRSSHSQSSTPSHSASPRSSQSRSSVFQGKPLYSQPSKSHSKVSQSQVSQAPVSHSRESHPQAEEQRALRQSLTQMEALQKELHDLRGVMEEQEHELKQLRKSQQDLYQDLERKMKTTNSSTDSSGISTGEASEYSAGSTTSVKPGIKADVKADSSRSGKKTLKSDEQTATASKAKDSATAKDKLANKEDKSEKADKINGVNGIRTEAKNDSKNASKNLSKNEAKNESKTANANSKILRTPPAGSPSKGPGLITRETAEDLGVISKTTPTPSQTSAQASTTASTPASSPTATIASKSNKSGSIDSDSIDDSKPLMTIKAEDPNKDTASKSLDKSSTSQTKFATLNENDAYQAAYGFVRSKGYKEAVEGLESYIKRFPQGTQAANAHYWLGEVYMVQWQADKSNSDLIEKASQEFKNVTTKFPNHAKAQDAVLKLGLIEIDRGNVDAARYYLSEVKTRYPGTAAARIADTRLQQLR